MFLIAYRIYAINHQSELLFLKHQALNQRKHCENYTFRKLKLNQLACLLSFQ